MSMNTGRIIHDRYRIVSLLGQGGMGTVYRAWDVSLSIPVALKEMRSDPNADAHTMAQLRQQFKREAQAVASLDYPNLVRATDCFSWDGAEWLVMPFVEGESLADCIGREGAQHEPRVLEWTRQLLDALAYCHARGVIHRDVKPQNVIITPEGKPVLVDFGLVKLWDPRDPHTQTAIRAMGTPEYAPPEQYSALGGHTDARSDLYSLGATLYHALTGQAPMSATDRMAMPEGFRPPRTLAPHVSPQTEATVLRAMALPMVQRFSTAGEMADALPGAPPPDGPARWPLAWARGLGPSVPVLLVVGCLLAAGLFLVLRCIIVPDPEPMPTPADVPTLPAPAVPTTPGFAETGGRSTVTAAPTAAARLSIAFDSYRDGHWEVYRMDERGLNLVNLTNHPADDGDPAWSCDGRWIAFDTDRDGNWEIYTMSTDGSRVTRLTYDPADDDSPAWSPDGSRVAFNSNRDGNLEIYVVNVSDLSVVNLTNHSSDDHLPAWSPDGTRIAFVSDRTGDWDIWAMNADGSHLVNLTRHPAMDSFPAWSPDGRRIAFHTYRDGNAEIYVMDADGSGVTRLTDHPADDWGPSWSPDGLRLAFTSDRDGNNEIHIMNVDDRSIFQLTSNTASDTWPVWSPSGHATPIEP